MVYKPVYWEHHCELSEERIVSRGLLQPLVYQGSPIASPKAAYSRTLHCWRVAKNVFGVVLQRLDLYVYWEYDGSRILYVDHWTDADGNLGWTVVYHTSWVSYRSNYRWRISAYALYEHPILGFDSLSLTAQIYANGSGSC